MVVKLSSFLSTSLAEGLDSALVTGIIAATDIALDSGTSGNYVAQITAGDGITVLNGAAHEATTIIKADSAVVATTDNTLTLTNKTLSLTNNTLTGTLGQFNAAVVGSTLVSTDGDETLTSKTLTSPTINTPTIQGPGSFSKITTLGLRDQLTNEYDLQVQSSSITSLTANRVLTLDVENVNRTLTLGGDITLDGDLRTAGDYGLLLNLSDSTNVNVPVSGTLMSYDSNGVASITGGFTASTLTGIYQGADSDITATVDKAFVDSLGVDASTLGGRDSDYFLNYDNFTNLPAGSAAVASMGSNPPAGPTNGQMWWDDSGNELYVYYEDSDGDTQWVQAVPQVGVDAFVPKAGGQIQGDLVIDSDLTVSGGIYLGGTTAVNYLDDYEEGTWTITDTSGAGLALTVTNNIYTKVGRLVTCSAVVTWPSTSDTNMARLSLPFTAVASSSQHGGVVCEQNLGSTTTITACVNYTDGVIFRPRGFGNFTNANLTAKKLRFTLTYHAA